MVETEGGVMELLMVVLEGTAGKTKKVNLPHVTLPTIITKLHVFTKIYMYIAIWLLIIHA